MRDDSNSPNKSFHKANGGANLKLELPKKRVNSNVAHAHIFEMEYSRFKPSQTVIRASMQSPLPSNLSEIEPDTLREEYGAEFLRRIQETSRQLIDPPKTTMLNITEFKSTYKKYL